MVSHDRNSEGQFRFDYSHYSNCSPVCKHFHMFYYRAIVRIGAAKAMALNITYTAWAIIFSVLILKDKSMLNPLTIGCAAIVVICGIFAATDIKKLFKVK